MNTSSNAWQVKSAIRQRVLPIDLFDDCAKEVNIPGNEFCPSTVQDIAQLANYYNQISLEEAYETFLTKDEGVYFPHAFYLDALDYGGTLRTGTLTLFGKDHEGAKEEYKVKRYGIVDTIIGYNVHTVCKDMDEGNDVDCKSYADRVKIRRSKFPAELWQEPQFGRRNDWPL